ncbi:hypothetical protein BDR04DRAFT_1117022 [Suillus decipiens]|nr:hypothetical protein BDR04DRAFT_1117022 [Suillus decipiens]
MKLKNMMEKDGGTLSWSEEYHVEFELEKTALICLSRKCIPSTKSPNKTIPAPQQPITICNHTIQPSRSHKFLGIIIDKDLNFREQAVHALAKGTKYTMACMRMVRTTRGIHGRLMKRLFEGVIIPKMLYTADIWCTGLILHKACYRATLRMASLPEQHPLNKGIKLAYNDYPLKLEKINPVRHYQKWELDVTMHIAEESKAVQVEDNLANEDLQAYSDGLMVDRGIGGATVLMRGEEVVGSKKFYLGSNHVHMVYEAKLVGIILVVQLLKEGGGHVGIKGNEEADEHAKRAAQGEMSGPRELPKSLTVKKNEIHMLPYSKSVLKQYFYTKIRLEATAIIKKSP